MSIIEMVEFYNDDSVTETIKKMAVYTYDETSLYLRRQGHNIILILALISYLMNFIPCWSSTLQHNLDDYYNPAAAQTSNYLFVVGSTALLMISILPGVDLLMDFLAPFTSSAYSKRFRSVEASETRDYNHLANKTTRLTLIERAMFIVGVISSAIAIFPAYQNTNPVNQVVIYNGFENNSVFVLCPILSFLTRSSTTWVPSLTITITLLACAANFTPTIAYVYPNGDAYFEGLTNAAGIMTIMATALYFAGLVASAYNTYVFHMTKSAKIHNTQDSLGAMDLLNEETIHHLTVGAQSCVTAIDFGTNFYWYYVGNNGINFDLTTTGIFMLIMSASNILTYLIEFRVRKSEVSTALYALLDSKKSYVRYISHELRTPMNVALLGVNLSRNDVKENADPDWGDGVVETLEDVELACSSAVNILNDLLSFEKMESGILELNSEPLVVISFINDCVRIFSLQAREKGVILKIDLTVTDEDIETGLYPVLPSDVVIGDRFKLEQVLRNLVSNALKFSPAGSTVTLGALYRPPSVKQQSTKSYKSSTKSSIKADPPNKVSSRIAKAFQSFGSFSTSKPTPDGSLKKSNAASSSRKGLHLAAEGGLLIRCIDQGAGISPENQAKLFRGVVQFNPEKLQAGGGSGFGMFISKGIIELHKGVMAVYSKGEGFGSTFSLEIPMQRTFPKIDAILRSGGDSESSISATDDFGSVNGVNRDTSVIIELTEIEEANDGDDNADATTEDYNLIGIAPTEESKDDIENSGDTKMVSSLMTKVTNYLPICQENTDATVQSLPTDATASTIPAVTPAVAVASTVKASPRTEGPQYRIFIVDDSAMNRKMMVKTMTAKGHKCEEAEDGVLAVEKMKATIAAGNTFDVILMDFIMPNMDGPSATKAIRALGVTIPIFGLTGNCMQRDMDWFTECGANYVLAKPLNMKEFERKLAEFKT